MPSTHPPCLTQVPLLHLELQVTLDVVGRVGDTPGDVAAELGLSQGDLEGAGGEQANWTPERDRKAGGRVVGALGPGGCSKPPTLRSPP